MDLSQITASQMMSENQLAYDAEAMDKAILRAESRREIAKAAWTNRAVLARKYVLYPLRRLYAAAQPASRRDVLK